MSRSNRLKMRQPFWYLGFVILLSLLLVAMAACGDDETTEEVAAEPTATEAIEEFAPERVFQVQISDDHTVDSVAYHPDGDMVAAGAFLEAHLMNPEDGETLDVIDFDHSIDDLEFSPDGSLIAAGQGVYGVQINNVDDGSVFNDLHGGYDNRLAFAPDGETIATANRNGVLWIWDVETGDELHEFVPPIEEFALSIAYSPDGELVALGNWDGDVFLFNAEDGELIRTFENPEDFGYAHDLAFSPDGEHLAIAGTRADRDDVLRVWVVDSGDEHGVVTLESDTRAVAYAADGEQIAVGDRDGVTIVDADDLTVIFAIELDAPPDVSAWVTDIDYSPDGRFLLFSRWDGYVELWQIKE